MLSALSFFKTYFIMKIIDYTFLPNGLIQIRLIGNQVLLVRRDVNSGKLITRSKVRTLSGVQHTGIWLGSEYHTGRSLIMHNHYQFGTAHISTYQDYALGQQVYFKGGRCVNDPSKVLQIALAEAKAGKPYDVILYNCQHFTSRACNNVHFSEDLAKWGAGLFGLAFIALLAGGFD